uniref:Uncharacterized protein n=1 Tax=Piliocolobus tephrosceles TaxID=591936 RepID=A0A8C9H320_9PRIM
ARGEHGHLKGARPPASACGEPGPLASLRLSSRSLELGKPRSEVKAPSGLSGLHSRSSPAPSASVEPQAWASGEKPLKFPGAGNLQDPVSSAKESGLHSEGGGEPLQIYLKGGLRDWHFTT